MEQFIKRIIDYVLGTHREQMEQADRALLLAGRQASWALSQRTRLRTLADAEFRVTSQWGEDGILEWLVQNVPVSSQRFIEFGVENYRQSNTRFLLQNRNWKGLVIDGSASHVQQIRADKLYWRYDLTAVDRFITTDNINGIFEEFGFVGDIGLLSIDIDGNDYWVWDAIDSVNPDIVVCEYNAIFGDRHAVTTPYSQKFNRFDHHHSGLHAGASIAALRHLGARKGYELVGSNSTGLNAFFVRKEHMPVIEPLLERRLAYPSVFRNACDAQRRLIHVGGLDRLELIKDLPVVDVVHGVTTNLAALGPAYSDEWLRLMKV
ncbi:hypothetical protein [Azospirillum sp. ST 5-10]|uniref:hypothetical protein n=1 Tax=unclassified Azospirillum TaxID=2630922 RepID=UPI003F4A3F98